MGDMADWARENAEAETAAHYAGDCDIGCCLCAVKEKKSPRKKWRACPRCGGQLVERTNKISQVRFMGCSTFPRCLGSVAMKNYHAAPKEPTK